MSRNPHTGHALDAAAEAEARDAGCDAYLRKPLLPEDLVAAIERVLHKRRGPNTKRG